MSHTLRGSTAESERHDTCCQDDTCRDCGTAVSTYNCNDPVTAFRPEAATWDWWVACDNADCPNSYGEGLFQNDIAWRIEGKSPPAEYSPSPTLDQLRITKAEAKRTRRRSKDSSAKPSPDDDGDSHE